MMDYVQRSPVPIPASGSHQKVWQTIDAVFDWEYALEEKKLLHLYEKGKGLAWNASDLNWGVDVDIAATAAPDIARLLNEVAPKRLTHDQAVEFHVHSAAFMLGQILHGEQGALLAAAKVLQTVPWTEAKLYAANQVSDEARHVEVYHRYVTEKMDVSYDIHPSLSMLLADVIEDSRWDITYLGLQIMIEGLALAAFSTIKSMLRAEPLIQDITARVIADESRHVAFGVLSLQKIYEGEMNAAELAEREDFIIGSAHLLYERLVPTPVFDRLGYDKAWTEWAKDSPTQRRFRREMFGRIVPALKRIGLLTPRVRQELAALGVLRLENEPT